MPRSWPVIARVRRIGEVWAQFWRGEYDRSTLRSVPSWGMSFLLHALMLLLLAFVFHLRRSGESLALLIQPAIVDTQLGDVTSLVDATRAGDPFTTNDSPDPPSLGLAPTDPDIKLVGQPQIASLSQFAPAMASPLLPASVKPGVASFAKSRTKGVALEGMMRLPEFAEAVSAPFSGRDGLTRAKLLRREGGTAKSEKSVDDGLAWIARHQRADGSWSLNFQDQCQAEPCPHYVARIDSDTAATGMALLPLLGAGHIHTVKTRYQESVRRGLEWLTAHQGPDGDLFVGPPGMAYLYSCAIATDGSMRGVWFVARPQPGASRSSGHRVYLQFPRSRRWRMALFARPVGRYVRLRLEHFRTAQRPSRRTSRASQGLEVMR